MAIVAEPARLARRHLAEPRSSWAIGTFGAIAEFHRDAGEPAVLTDGCAVTGRGGIRLQVDGAVRVVAWEAPAGRDAWTHGVSFCLPGDVAAMNERAVLTELGPDHDALLEEDRDSTLFDMGVVARHCDVCVRTGDRAAARALRSATGRRALDPGLLSELRAIGPARVFVSRLGRVEVRTPIPPPGGTTPDGPHTHVLPHLLLRRRAHSANVPLPTGMLPCADLFPASPIQDAHGHRRPFTAAEHEAFQSLLGVHGDPAWLAAKRETMDAVRASRLPRDVPAYSRAQRLARRVALRQLAQTDGDSPALQAWLRAYDREPRRVAGSCLT